MKHFKIGDRVKCINTKSLFQDKKDPPALILGREYIVYKTITCPHGRQGIDVGLVARKLSTLSQFPICNCLIDTHDSAHYCASERFEKVLEKTEYKTVKLEIEIEEPILS